jgi:hypothetical protein
VARRALSRLRPTALPLGLITMKSKLITIAFALLIPLSAYSQYAWELIKQPAFKSAYLNVLGSKAKEAWLAHLSGPSSQAIQQTIRGEEYLLAHSCRQHACNIDNIVFAYSSTSNRVFAKLVENGSVQWLGDPPPEIQAELEAYYAKQFGKK